MRSGPKGAKLDPVNKLKLELYTAATLSEDVDFITKNFRAFMFQNLTDDSTLKSQLRSKISAIFHLLLKNFQYYAKTSLSPNYFTFIFRQVMINIKKWNKMLLIAFLHISKSDQPSSQ